MRAKKGIFFTIIAVLIMSTLLVAFTPRNASTIKDALPVTQTRVLLADDLVNVIKTAYIPMAVTTSGYNALNALSLYVKARGELFADFDELNRNFAEVMLNGTIACEPPLGAGEHLDIEECLGLPADAVLMRERNLTGRLADIENATLDVGLPVSFLTTYGDYEIILFQDNASGPFRVGVNLTLNFSLNAGVAWWNSTVNISTLFRFDGIEDPLYSVRSSELLGTQYVNRFNQSNLTVRNITMLFREAEHRRYRYAKEGASFLTRFTMEDVPSECCGIESIINPLIMDDADIGTIERPYVDWCMFGNRCPLDVVGALWNISCITQSAQGSKFYRFSLDSAHLAAYNLTEDDPVDGIPYFYQLTDPRTPQQCTDLMQDVCSISEYPCQ
jgi:hypothetical protein